MADIQPPSYAEEHLLSDYHLFTTERSKLVSGKTHIVQQPLDCPRCHGYDFKADHLQTEECPQCHLTIHVAGNKLYMWDRVDYECSCGQRFNYLAHMQDHWLQNEQEAGHVRVGGQDG